VRELNKILELDIELGPIGGLHYKVDRNHDIVYMELEVATVTFREIRSIFRKLGLDPKSSVPFRRNCGQRPGRSFSRPERARLLSHVRQLDSRAGETAVSFAVYVGDVVMLAVETVGAAFAQKIRWRLFLQQIVEIGLRSQVVVMITGAFTGAVLRPRPIFNSTSSGWGLPWARSYRFPSAASSDRC